MADEANTGFDFTPAYKAEGYGGVAWRVTKYAMVLDGVWEDDDCYDEWEVEDRTQVVAHMIGDDRDFTFDVADLTPIDDESFCRECGQIGCGHNVYD